MNDAEARDYARHLIYFTAYGFRVGSQFTFTEVFNTVIGPIIKDYPLVVQVCPFDPEVVDWVTLSAAAGVWMNPDSVAYYPFLAAARPEQARNLLDCGTTEDIVEFTQRFAQAMVDGNVKYGWCGDFERLTNQVCHDLAFTLPPPSEGTAPEPGMVAPYLLDSQSK